MMSSSSLTYKATLMKIQFWKWRNWWNQQNQWRPALTFNISTWWEIGLILLVFYFIELDFERKVTLRLFFFFSHLRKQILWINDIFRHSPIASQTCLGNFPEKPSLKKSQANKYKTLPPIISLGFTNNTLHIKKMLTTKGNKCNFGILRELTWDKMRSLYKDMCKIHVFRQLWMYLCLRSLLSN